MVSKENGDMLKKIAEYLVEMCTPKCPYCNSDVSYAYYGPDGKYCPNCLKKIKEEK